MTVEIPGYFDYQEFYKFIAKKFGKSPWTAIEIGVFNGKSASFLLRESTSLTLHLVDHFKNSSIYETLTYLKEDNDSIVIHPTYSSIARHRFAKESCDFIFIDADHTYEGCLKDITDYFPLLKHGGIIAGHDYSHSKYEVKKAVKAFFNEDFLTFDDAKSIWYHVKL